MEGWNQIIANMICNGICLLILGKWIDVRLEKDKRKEHIIYSFFKKLVKLNASMIEINMKIQVDNISDINVIIKLLKKKVFTSWIDIISFYDTYQYDLKELESYYRNMEKFG